MPNTTQPFESASLGPLADRVNEALNDLNAQSILQRIRRPDHTVWSQDPTEITEPNRLGWLDVASEMAGEAAGLREFAHSVAADGYTRTVLLGMGGSSLASEVLQTTFGAADGMLPTYVMDTTHPDSVVDLTHELELEKALFIVASKSGSTIETLSHFHYFWELIPEGAHFVAITDEGSQLHRLGEERGFRRVFLNRADIGGRYSALSYFGLVPAALAGIDLDALLTQANTMASACSTDDAEANPGAYLGTVIGEAALAGRDKLTLFLPDAIASFGDWVEQLIAESTGKHGKGIVPVVHENAAPAGTYGNDRLFVAIGEHTDLPALEAAGHPVVKLAFEGPEQLGAEFFRWQFATAVAGQRLAINPFDQPNVQSAKDATAHILEQGEAQPPSTPDIGDLLSGVEPPDYIAVLAYTPHDMATARELQGLRLALRDRFLVATTLGIGPRYLHSTGQLHKGGPNTGLFVLITDDAANDAEIPGQSYTFGRLIKAQAMGDLQSLIDAGRRVTHIHIEGERISHIQALRKGMG